MTRWRGNRGETAWYACGASSEKFGVDLQSSRSRERPDRRRHGSANEKRYSAVSGIMARAEGPEKRRLRPKTAREQERQAPRSEGPIDREAPSRPGLPAAAPE
jgi:hypothetical protein